MSVSAYLVRWQWIVEDYSYWSVPNALGKIDLRSIPQMSMSGGTPQGYAVAAFPGTITDPNAVFLGDDIRGAMPLGRRRGMARELGFSTNDLDSVSNLTDALWRVMTVLADPTGNLRHKPLMPKRDGTLELNLTGYSTIMSKKLIPFQSEEWDNILNLLRNDYRIIRSETLKGNYNENAHRKFLMALKEKYRLNDTDIFIPDDLPKETPLPHSTTITEVWGCADSGNINCDLTWTEVVGDLSINSNAVGQQTVNIFGSGRAETDLATDDHYGQVDIVSLTVAGSASEMAGPLARFNPSAETYYMSRIHNDSSGTELTDVFKNVTGSFTSIGSAVGITISIPDTLKLSVDGSTLINELNGVEKHNFSDTAITGHLRAGIFLRMGGSGSANDIKVDNFEAADIAAAGGIVVLRRRIEGA